MGKTRLAPENPLDRRPAAPSSAVAGTYSRAPVLFERGEGSWLISADGDRYLDFGSGVAVNAFGHAHPRLVAALKAQAEKLWHTSNLYRVAGQERLAERLTALSFADKVFFCNSGAEACEGAIKAARRYHFAAGQPERSRIVTFEGAFHGRTLATIAAGGNRKYMEGFGPDMPGFDQVPFGDHDALEKAMGPETAAVMIEPVQGEGGVRVVPPRCLTGLRELCDRHGALLIFDEVQSGMGRTGRLFAHEWAGVAPDIMAIAKGLGGGFPVGAFLMTDEVAAPLSPGTHGSTFGGNPLAMAVASEVLAMIEEEGFLEAVVVKANRLKQGLASLQDRFPDLVTEVRGAGLLAGLKLTCDVPAAVRAALGERLLTVGAGDNVMRILPPLNVTDADIAEGIARLGKAFAALSKS